MKMLCASFDIKNKICQVCLHNKPHKINSDCEQICTTGRSMCTPYVEVVKFGCGEYRDIESCRGCKHEGMHQWNTDCDKEGVDSSCTIKGVCVDVTNLDLQMRRLYNIELAESVDGLTVILSEIKDMVEKWLHVN